MITSELERRRTADVQPATFKPLAHTHVRRLGESDLRLLAEGRIAEIFGAAFDQRGANPSLRLPDTRLRMIDEITELDRTGGTRGLGQVTAVKRLQPDGWYFTCHFTDDPVLAGSLVAEGGVQILQVFALSLGMQLCLPDAAFQTVPGLETRVRVRGQITPDCTMIRYAVNITGLTLLPRPTVIADIVVYDGDKAMVAMDNFGIQLREKPGTPAGPAAGGRGSFLGRYTAAGEPTVINELHLAHAAKGDLTTAMGPEFEVHRHTGAPHIPNGDFQFVDRMVTLDGVRGAAKPGDRMITEYDSPADAWYYRENAFVGMPNCVHMETSLQAAILLGYYLGATLDVHDQRLHIRNLDGQATHVADVGLRGRTIRHTSTLLSSDAIPGAVLQRFSYELSVDGEVFYVGESLFGYFTSDMLANQAGLDGGRRVGTWLDAHPEATVRRIELDRLRAADRPGLRLGSGRLHLLDELELVDGGGDHQLAYLRARRAVRPDDWYFDCHFHRDPVMPGSLGVEAIIQTIQAYVLAGDLAAGIPDPQFATARDVPMSWTYRGQILRGDDHLVLDIHVKDVRRDDDRLVVVADASLFKPGLRIYAVTDVAVEVRPGATTDRQRSDA